jgi:molybdopterin biosynthesis enzyme
MLGIPDPRPDFRRGILGAAVTRNPQREEYVRAASRRDGEAVIHDPLAGRESHMIARAGRADALVAVEAGEGEIAAGEDVRYLALSSG